MPAKIISAFNGKGGAGKTTLVTNINAHMKTKELKLLVIDTDPQRNLYGINAPNFVHYEPSLFNIMKKEISIKKVIQQTDGYHLIPTSDNQNDLKYNLVSKRQSIINRSIVDNFRRMSRIFGFKIFSTSIPKNVDVNAASAHHKNIFQYKEKSPAATAYKQLTDEIITFINMGGEQ